MQYFLFGLVKECLNGTPSAVPDESPFGGSVRHIEQVLSFFVFLPAELAV